MPSRCRPSPAETWCGSDTTAAVRIGTPGGAGADPGRGTAGAAATVEISSRVGGKLAGSYRAVTVGRRRGNSGPGGARSVDHGRPRIHRLQAHRVPQRVLRCQLVRGPPEFRVVSGPPIPPCRPARRRRPGHGGGSRCPRTISPAFAMALHELIAAPAPSDSRSGGHGPRDGRRRAQGGEDQSHHAERRHRPCSKHPESKPLSKPRLLCHRSAPPVMGRMHVAGAL